MDDESTPLSPQPLAGEGPLVTRLVDTYFEVARRYQLRPVAAVTIALRLDQVTHLRLDPAYFHLSDLLPLGEVLKVRGEHRVPPCALPGGVGGGLGHVLV